MSPHDPSTALEHLLASIELMPLNDKIVDVPHYNDFADYLESHPLAFAELARFVSALPGGLTEDRLVALHHWATQLEMEDVEVARDSQQRLNVVFIGSDKTPMLLVDREPDHYNLVRMKAKKDAVEEIMRVEELWAKTGIHAPVVKVFFSGQTEDDRGKILQSHEEDRWQWDGSEDLFAVPLAQRNEACKHDNYASDQLRDSKHANECARGWNGPYAVSASLYYPSPRLVSLRQTAQLAMATPQAQPAARGPRL